MPPADMMSPVARQGKQDVKRNTSTPPKKKRHKQPLLPDPGVPKFSDLVSMTPPTYHSVPGNVDPTTAMQMQQQQQNFQQAQIPLNPHQHQHPQQQEQPVFPGHMPHACNNAPVFPMDAVNYGPVYLNAVPMPDAAGVTSLPPTFKQLAAGQAGAAGGGGTVETSSHAAV